MFCVFTWALHLGFSFCSFQGSPGTSVGPSTMMVRFPLIPYSMAFQISTTQSQNCTALEYSFNLLLTFKFSFLTVLFVGVVVMVCVCFHVRLVKNSQKSILSTPSVRPEAESMLSGLHSSIFNHRGIWYLTRLICLFVCVYLF